MTDIELVIKISKEDFEIMKHNIAVNNPLCPLSQEEMVSKVASGIPLPKGHGRLIDADSLFSWFDGESRAKYPIKDGKQYDTMMFYEIFDEIDNAPTIIEGTEDKE